MPILWSLILATCREVIRATIEIRIGGEMMSSPQVKLYQERISTLTNWASTNSTVTTTLTSGAVSATTSLISDYAITTFNCSVTTARNYAHVVVLNLALASG